MASASNVLYVLSSASISGSNSGDQIVPQNTNSTSGQFFNAYNNTTGSFTTATALTSFSASGVSPISVSGGSIVSHDDSGVISGSYSAVIVDSKGHVTSGSNPVLDHTINILNVGTNSHSQIDSDLLRLVNTTGSNTGDQVVPQNKTSTSNQFFIAYNNTTGSFTTGSSLTGFSASGVSPINVSGGSIISLDVTGVVSGSYNQVIVDAWGRVTSASFVSVGGGGTTYTGSLPIVVTGSVVSHATSGITSGSYNKIYVDDKGHVTAGSIVATHYEILQDDAGAILTDSNGIDILYVEVA